MIATAPLLETYRRLGVTFHRGEGVWLYDTSGKQYLDFLSGLAVCSLGHAHPALTEALREQAGRLLHVSNLFSTPQGEKAATALVAKIAPGRIFFCNSGAEANEAAIKLVRKRSWRRAEPDRIEVVSLEGSFHGRTLAALAATAQPKKHEGFDPLPSGFSYVPFGDAGALREAVGPQTAAVFLESVQGEGGVRPLTKEYARTAEQLCREHGALLVFDEVQTGAGRTGRWWGYEHLGVRPDVVTMAKGIGGGVPVGAMWVSEEHAGALGPGDHASTFGGGPLACAAILCVLETIENDGLVSNAEAMGQRLQSALEPVGRVRGMGLLRAVELGRPVAGEVVRAALERGLIVNDVTPSALRLAPPLIVGPDEIDEAVVRLRAAVEAVG